MNILAIASMAFGCGLLIGYFALPEKKVALPLLPEENTYWWTPNRPAGYWKGYVDRSEVLWYLNNKLVFREDFEFEKGAIDRMRRLQHED